MIELEAIGKIYTPFNKIKGMPIQPNGAKGTKGKIQIKNKFKKGLKDLERFSHIELYYYLHKVNSYSLEVTPFLDDKPHGIFATRSPKRPNQIGFSVVEIERIEESTIFIKNVDILNETPLLDIKPFVPQLYDKTINNLKIGWFENKTQNADNKKSDKRFL